MSKPILEIFGVYDRGVPNQERVVLRANAAVDLSQFFLFLGVRAPLDVDDVFPIADQFLWLGRRFADADTWVFVYTGKGTPSVTTEKTTKQPVQSIYWDKSSVVFLHKDIVPVLATIGGMQIGNKPDQHLPLPPSEPEPEIDWLKVLEGMSNLAAAAAKPPEGLK